MYNIQTDINENNSGNGICRFNMFDKIGILMSRGKEQLCQTSPPYSCVWL